MDKKDRVNIDINQLSELAMLVFSEEEKELLEAEMRELLVLASKLDEINVSENDDTQAVSVINNVLRADDVKDSFERENMICGAHTKSDGFITVPRVVEG